MKDDLKESGTKQEKSKLLFFKRSDDDSRITHVSRIVTDVSIAVAILPDVIEGQKFRKIRVIRLIG